MNKNENLRNAKKQKKDEFYTQLSDIENELRHYKQHFKGKVVFCNCDDPYESNFFKYFAMNFNSLGLKKLIATGYVTSPVAGKEISLFSDEVDIPKNQPYVVYINEVTDINGDGRTDLDDVKLLLRMKKNIRRKLYGDDNYPAGDFRSEESISLLKQADVVVTNPPFSLFREYVAQLMEYEKKFLIIGNVNSLQCKEIFPLIKNNKVWIGYKFNGTPMRFTVPDYYELTGTVNGYFSDGKKFIGIGGTCWYTNLDIKKRHEELILWKKYTPNEYPKYDNFDAININKTTDIPCDYEGVMGVPISFIDKYNPDQFELISIGSGTMAANIGVKKNYRGRTDISYTLPNGKHVCPYGRILIRKRKPAVS